MWGRTANVPSNKGVQLSGVLEKQSDVLKKWNARYFSLDVRGPRQCVRSGRSGGS